MMVNPFTKYLRGGLDDGALQQFVEQWDRVEALAIRVFKAKGATAGDEETYQQARTALLALYPTWQVALEPLWRQTIVGGELAQSDPFLFVLAPEQAAGFVGFWRALQHLPAAREALNQLVANETGRVFD